MHPDIDTSESYRSVFDQWQNPLDFQMSNHANAACHKHRNDLLEKINTNPGLLKNIFHYLSNKEDFKSCALVCRHWKDALNSPSWTEKFSRIKTNFWKAEAKVLVLSFLLCNFDSMITKLPPKLKLNTIPMLDKIYALGLFILSARSTYRALTTGATKTTWDSIRETLISVVDGWAQEQVSRGKMIKSIFKASPGTQYYYDTKTGTHWHRVR